VAEGPETIPEITFRPLRHTSKAATWICSSLSTVDSGRTVTTRKLTSPALRLISTRARLGSTPRSVVETRIGEDYGRFGELFRLRRGHIRLSLGYISFAELLDDLAVQELAPDHRKFSISIRSEP